jgi:hypothetical protein
VGHEVGVVSPLDQDAKGRLNIATEPEFQQKNSNFKLTKKICKKTAKLAPFIVKAGGTLRDFSHIVRRLTLRKYSTGTPCNGRGAIAEIAENQ